MSVEDLLGSLARQGGHLEVVGDRLVYCGPRHLLSDEARRVIDQHRDAIVTFLRKPVSEMTRHELAAFDLCSSVEPLDESRLIRVTDEVIAKLNREEARRAADAASAILQDQSHERRRVANSPPRQLGLLIGEAEA